MQRLNSLERPKSRTRMQIVGQLLKIAMTPVLKTHMMYKANLSHSMTNYYVKILCEAGLLEETFDENRILKLYRVTPKGMKYLEICGSIEKILGIESNKPNYSPTNIFVSL